MKSPPIRIKRLHFLLVLLAGCLCAIPFRNRLQGPLLAALRNMRGRQTVAGQVARFGPAARARMRPDFARIGIPYPPQRLTLVGLKHEKSLEVWVAGTDGAWKPLRSYPILAASGSLGPKLREGDMQVPEGVYQLESLNPNSSFHLALRVNYPNEEDRLRAREDGRANPGSDIMIHGNDCSVGCLAMGDEAAEDLFVLAAETRIKDIPILLSPVDFRRRRLPDSMPPVPGWMHQRYDSIRQALEKLTTPAN